MLKYYYVFTMRDALCEGNFQKEYEMSAAIKMRNARLLTFNALPKKYIQTTCSKARKKVTYKYGTSKNFMCTADLKTK